MLYTKLLTNFNPCTFFTDGLGATESLFAGVVLGGNDPIHRDTDG